MLMRPPLWADLKQLPCLTATSKEVMHIYPVVSHGMSCVNWSMSALTWQQWAPHVNDPDSNTYVAICRDTTSGAGLIDE